MKNVQCDFILFKKEKCVRHIENGIGARDRDRIELKSKPFRGSLNVLCEILIPPLC